MKLSQIQLINPLNTAFVRYAEADNNPPYVPPTLQDIAWRIAEEEGFDPQIVFNVINSETGSTWNCDLVGAAGEIGCLQIIPRYHPNVDPKNFVEAVRYFIDEYRAGREWQWVACNCWGHIKANRIHNLPRSSQIVPNTKPSVGTVAIFKYGTVIHYAYVEKLEEKGFWVYEANYESCKIAYRFIPWEYEPLQGFYTP